MAQQEPVPPQRSRGRIGAIITAAFKTGIALYERGRERAAELGEFASDMMAEARAEYDSQQTVAGAADDPLPANEVVRLRDRPAREAGAPNA